MTLEAVDLFAGTGWGVACQRLGIVEHGVENMPEAVASRSAAGMHTWMLDVWDVLEDANPDSPELNSNLLIASPPCQTFSMAGKGAGRAALDQVLELISSSAFADLAKLRVFGTEHDARTALVLTPLAYVAKHRPTYVVLEQVPTVLPVWEACAVVLRGWGYSVAVANLQAEMYGVPQTRKRAILIGRRDGIEAAMPAPTHSRYYPREPKRLDDGVLPWVSMAEALGHNGRLVSNYSSGGRGIAVEGNRLLRGYRDSDEPAFTITGKATKNKWRWSNGQQAAMTLTEAAVLQSFPQTFMPSGSADSRALQIGNAVPPLLAQAVLSTLLP